MRVGLLLLIIATLTLLVVQNSTPALPLVLFGSSTIALPVGLWLLIGIGAGLVTSFLIQGLTFRPAPTAAAPARSPQVAPRYRRRDPEAKTRRSAQPDWEPPNTADWDAPPDDPEGWDIETPPAQPTTPRPRTVRNSQSRTPERPSPDEGVVDADYRVIEPPTRPPNAPDNRDENWDF